MLLRAPAASLKDLKAYADLLNQHGFPYFAVATKISFDVKESFPKFVFAATRPLTDDEAKVVAEFRDGPLVNNILNTSIEMVHHEPDAPAVPASPFTQAQTPAAQTPAAQPAAVAQPAQPAQPVQTPAAQPATAPAAEPQKRTRRTKAEMEAAAQALKDKRNGVAAPAGAAPAQPAQPAQAQPMASPEALAAASSDDEPSADEIAPPFIMLAGIMSLLILFSFRLEKNYFSLGRRTPTWRMVDTVTPGGSAPNSSL